MKILKEKNIEKFECIKCGSPLEYYEEERIVIGKKFFGLLSKWKYTDNCWYDCDKCNKRYLIEDALNAVHVQEEEI